MNVLLEDAEEKQVTNPTVQMWIDKLKDVAYKAEDILDEIATETLQRNLDAEFRPVAGKVRNSISRTFLNPFVHRVETKIKEVLDRLEDLANQTDNMGLKVGVGGKQYPEMLTTSHVVVSDTFGRDKDKKKVIDLLLSLDAERNEMCGVIAILGMGGIGKTTLAQLVYNENEVNEHFHSKIWFCVSKEFDKIKIMKSIIEAVPPPSISNIEDPEWLQVNLKEKLNGKKFLLVLDDVWSEKPIHREFLGQLLQFGAPGSKILITSRNESVARAMHVDATHHLKELPEDDCWSLFEKHAFLDGSSKADPKIKEIGEKIVHKCKGLPLAIKAIGDLLWFESDVKGWENILGSDLWNVSLQQADILPALRLSYKYLPSYLKPCFAYCSIFPKDYIFKKNRLVLLWMAEGFLQRPGKISMEEVGNRYFDALVSRSLFQQSSKLDSGYVMHDIVNDLAMSVSGQFGLTWGGDSSEKIGSMTRYLSFINLHESEKIEEDLYKVKQLRAFVALYSGISNSKIKMPRTWCLRTLSIPGKEGIIKWLDSISNMKHLRYLDVSSTSISRLPSSICMLCNLQTLKLSDCRNLERLPRDMWKLINLRHLEFDGPNKLWEMPVKMGRLICLQTLTNFIVSKNSGSCIGELGKLMNLRGKLAIMGLQHVRSVELDSLDAILKDKVYLEELFLRWTRPKEFSTFEEIDQRIVLENLQPHENLKSFTIRNYGGTVFPDWIGGLLSLSVLELIYCESCEALPPLGQLPSLIKLLILGLNGVDTVGPEFYGNGLMKPFERLKFLTLKHMYQWTNWFHLGAENEVETFSQHEKLHIDNCPMLRGKLLVHLPSLSVLEISRCYCLEGSLPVELFPKLTRMRISRCHNLESLALGDQQYEHGRTTDFNSCIEELEIHECYSLVSLPRNGLFSTLKSLEISNCVKLELPMQRQYSSLEKLCLDDCCDSLTSIPLDIFPNLKGITVCNCPDLTDIFRDGCERLRSMSEKMHLFLPSLSSLVIRNCPEVESFPEGGLPSNLKEIEITDCKRLIANWREWGLERLPSLEKLEIGGGEVEDVESFTGQLLLPTTLRSLRIKSFLNLKSLEKEGFQPLISLVNLKIEKCPKLEYMPEEGFPASLHFLVITECCPELEKEMERKEGKEWLKVARVPNIYMTNYGRIQGHDAYPSGFFGSLY